MRKPTTSFSFNDGVNCKTKKMNEDVIVDFSNDLMTEAVEQPRWGQWVYYVGTVHAREPSGSSIPFGSQKGKGAQCVVSIENHVW